MAITESHTITRKYEPNVVEVTEDGTFETKKTLFRASQVVWYILGLLESVILLRFVFKLLGASRSSLFVNFIYDLTEPFVFPFKGIVAAIVSGVTVIEWASVIAAIIYILVAWGIVYLLDLFFPLTPEDV
jgi:hypothetical protein